jgi:hypothetical protein
VGNWVTLPMTERIFPKGNITSNTQADLYMLPTVIANQYYGEIAGISEKLLDYYVEVTDNNGNITKSKIQHVWVGKNLDVAPKIAFEPASNYSANPIDVIITATDSTDPSPKVYYTTDGSTPTTSSANFISTKTINITETTTFNILAVDVDGNQSTATQKFTVGAITPITVYFKPLASWGIPKIYYWSALPSGAVPSITWAQSIAMTADTDGWYKYTFAGVTSVNVIFRNQAGNIQSPDLTGITADKWFDSSYNDVTLSISEKEFFKNDFILYPNPTYGTLKIESQNKVSEAGVFDIQGKLVSFQSIGSNQQIELGNLTPGTYIVKMITEDRKTVFKQIIKK